MVSLDNRLFFGFNYPLCMCWASLVAQLVKNLPSMQETPVWFLVGKIRWRRDSLPFPVFLGFPGGSAGKECACNSGDLGPIPWLGRSPGEGNGLPTPVFWPGECIVHCKESDMTEWLSLTYVCAAAAAAKLLQLCPTLWNPIDGSPLGSPVPGILQARTLEWVAISFSMCMCYWLPKQQPHS